MVRKNERGITLIALVISIIILLILAGITILAISGENGIIQRAVEAREKTEEATLEEKIKLLTAENIINEYTGESEEKTAQELQDELNDQGENVLVVQWDKYIIYDLDKNKEYRVMSDGSVEYWEESTMGQILLNTKTANSDQISQSPSTNNIIGIDNEGNTVNMLLWEYTLIDDSTLGKIGTYGLNDAEALTGSGNNRSAGYLGGYTEDGKIIGTVPAYISEDGGNTYVSVTSMAHTFYDCDELVIAPEIANTVTNMKVTFYQSNNLTTAPNEIPDSVINFSYAFASCERLNTIPILGKNIENMDATFRSTTITKFDIQIPESVKNMKETFSGCMDLTTFTVEIPNSVTNMESTFSNCISLIKFDSKISTNVTNMKSTFKGCETLSTFLSTIPQSVTNMQSTFLNCKSLTKAPDIIPNSVTNMFQTFYGCENLTGIIQINANLTGKMIYNYRDYEQCFSNAATSGEGLIISKGSTCPELENLINTKSSNSNITLEE